MLMENLKSEELLVNEEVMDLPDVDPHLHLRRQHSRFAVIMIMKTMMKAMVVNNLERSRDEHTIHGRHWTLEQKVNLEQDVGVLNLEMIAMMTLRKAKRKFTSAVAKATKERISRISIISPTEAS